MVYSTKFFLEWTSYFLVPYKYIAEMFQIHNFLSKLSAEIRKWNKPNIKGTLRNSNALNLIARKAVWQKWSHGYSWWYNAKFFSRVTYIWSFLHSNFHVYVQYKTQNKTQICRFQRGFQGISCWFCFTNCRKKKELVCLTLMFCDAKVRIQVRATVICNVLLVAFPLGKKERLDILWSPIEQ